MKGLKTKANWYISLKYLCISYNDRDAFFHATMILPHLLKLMKPMVVKSFKHYTIQALMKMRGFKNILV